MNIEEEKKTTIDSTAMEKKPLCVLIVGMAGSGKTTFVNQLAIQAKNQSAEKKEPYIINLDPAVLNIPYSANIDIRSTIKYKDLMKSYNLGPNGGILTSLNLFSTKFDQVLDILEEKASDRELIIIDTPGQIEVFTWSASGMIISNAIASAYPCVMIYVIDLARCNNPNTFMSNMLYCCSIMYKMKLPVVCVLNKADVGNYEEVNKWMKDYDTYLKALNKDDSYLSTLSRSMCLVLDEFYKDLNCVPFSSLTGFGAGDLFKAFTKARSEYFEVYYADLQKNQLKQQKLSDKEVKKVEKELTKFKNDVEKDEKTGEKKKPQKKGEASGEKQGVPFMFTIQEEHRIDETAYKLSDLTIDEKKSNEMKE